MKNLKRLVAIAIIGVTLTGCSSTKETTLKDENTKSLDTALSKGSNIYDYGLYTLKESKKTKELDITLEFKTNDVFKVGTVTAIRNLVLENLEGKYSENEIKLTVASEKPTDLVDYIYKDGKWDKEVE